MEQHHMDTLGSISSRPGSKRSGSRPRRERTTSTTSSYYVDSEDENQLRGNWSGKLDFILSCLSYAVGLGNVWRFPYQCYRNGGGAFLLPFTLMLGLIGLPLFFLESSFGQYANSGVISIWKASPLFKGIGGGMLLVSFFVSLYYNMIIAWTFFYLASSFQNPLPWATCDNWWNTDACRIQGMVSLERNCTSHNGTWMNNTCASLANTSATNTAMYSTMSPDLGNDTVSMVVNVTEQKFKSPSDEFFHNYILDISSGFDDFGYIRWQLVLCLLLSWTLVCICMIKGIKSSGRVVYFTATFPYLVLLVLLVRGLTLPGSFDGIAYYVTPRWHKLLDGKVWADAAVQIFFSLAPGWGGLITLSSYNKFNNNCLRDAYIVSIGDVLTSFFAGFVIFSILGFMAWELNSTVDKVADVGAGLAFIVYPEVVTRLPAAPIWAILFFLMLITLGLGTQFAIVNTVHTTILDVFPGQLRQGHRPSYIMIALCFVSFILGLTMCTQGGMFMLQLMDSYSATYNVLVIALVECLALTYVYGYDQLKADIKLMLGKSIGPYWMIMWKFVSPLTLVGIMIFTAIEFKRTSYGGYVFPWWADLLGWCITLTSIMCIPAAMLYQICTKYPQLSLRARIRRLCRPTSDFGPSLYRDPCYLDHHKMRLSGEYEREMYLNNGEPDTFKTQGELH